MEKTEKYGIVRMIGGALLAIALIVLIFSMLATPVKASEGTYENTVPEEAYTNKAIGLEVNGVLVTDETGAVIDQTSDESAGWSYDAETNTLTLKDANITKIAKNVGAIFYNGGDLIIRLIGENVINAKRSSGSLALSVYVLNTSSISDLYILGDGSLNAAGEMQLLSDGLFTVAEGASITIPQIGSSGSFSVIESTLCVTAPENSDAIYADDGTLLIKKSNVTVMSESAGISSISGDLIIEDSFVTVSCVDNALYAALGKLELSGSHVETFSSKNYSNRGKSTVLSDLYYNYNGDVSVKGDAVLRESITVPAEDVLTVPSGASLTIPEGITVSLLGSIDNKGAITVNGTMELPATATKDDVVALGMTGTGSLKLGNAVLSADGACIVHESDNENYCVVCGDLIIERVFADAGLRTYIAENIDKDKSGALSASEIDEAAEIDVSYNSVSDLAGIEIFTNLVKLNVSRANITSIDVSVFTKLEELYLANCFYLKSLNLKANTELAILDVDGSGLTELDLSNNPNAGLLMGENTAQTLLKHCGVGSVDMTQFGDLSRMTVVSGGTLGDDGRLKLDENATTVVYKYDTKNNPRIAADFYVEIIINSLDFDHAYVANIMNKDETGHYTQSCSICGTADESSLTEHTIKYEYVGYTDSQHKEYCKDCDFAVIEACGYASECESNCSECALTTRILPDEAHSFIYTPTPGSEAGHEYYCENCSLTGFYTICDYEFACTETCICGRANPDLTAHTEKYASNGAETHDRSCEICGKMLADDETHGFNDGVCACGYACLHENLSDVGFCGDCNKQYALIVTNGGETFFSDDLRDAWSKALESTEEAPGVITLKKDIEYSDTAYLQIYNGYIILDLNGKTLNITSKAMIRIYDDNTLVIRDSSEAKNGVLNTFEHIYVLEANMILESGKLIGSGGDYGMNPVITLIGGATLLQTGGTIETGDSVCCIDADDSFYTQNGGTLRSSYPEFMSLRDSHYVLNDGSLIYIYDDSWMGALLGSIAYMMGDSTAVINGGYISVNGLGDIDDTSTMTINSGVFTLANDSVFQAGLIEEGATLLLKGGVFEGGLCIDDGGTKTLVDFLAPDYTFYDENGNVIALTEGQTAITGKVTVACSHPGKYLSLVSNNNGTHDKVCTFCEAILSDNEECSYQMYIRKNLIVSLPTCVSGTVYYMSCACGHNIDETFEDSDVDPDNHTDIADDGDCTTAVICGGCYVEVIPAEDDHDFSGEYLHDANGHWKKCEKCNVTDTKSDHYGQSPNDCALPTLCECGYVVEPAKGHGSTSVFYTDDYHYEGCLTCSKPVDDVKTPHDFSITQNNEYDHWGKCSGCDKENEHIPHSGDNGGDCTKDSVCTCGYVTKTGEAAHDFGENYLSDEEGHYHKCENCDVTDTKIAHSGTDDGDCTTDVICFCGGIALKASSHSFDNACDTDCNNTGCTYTRTTSHTPKADDGDCTTAIRCSVCDAVTTAGNASHTGGTATCTAQAVCEICDTPYGGTVAHSYTVCENDETHHWNKCEICDAASEKQAHTVEKGVCTVCEYKPEKDGLSGGAIAAISVSSAVVLGGGGFALWWFVFKKKKVI